MSILKRQNSASKMEIVTKAVRDALSPEELIQRELLALHNYKSYILQEYTASIEELSREDTQVNNLQSKFHHMIELTQEEKEELIQLLTKLRLELRQEEGVKNELNDRNVDLLGKVNEEYCRKQVLLKGKGKEERSKGYKLECEIKMEQGVGELIREKEILREEVTEEEIKLIYEKQNKDKLLQIEQTSVAKLQKISQQNDKFRGNISNSINEEAQLSRQIEKKQKEYEEETNRKKNLSNKIQTLMIDFQLRKNQQKNEQEKREKMKIQEEHMLHMLNEKMRRLSEEERGREQNTQKLTFQIRKKEGSSYVLENLHKHLFNLKEASQFLTLFTRDSVKINSNLRELYSFKAKHFKEMQSSSILKKRNATLL